MVEEATHNAWRWCWVHRRGRERVLLLMLIASSLRADAPAESGPESGPEIVVDMPAHGVTELRPWQFVHGRILHRPSDPPIYLSTTLWGSPSGRAIALQVPALFSKHTAIRQTAQSLTKPLGWSCHEANRVTNDTFSFILHLTCVVQRRKRAHPCIDVPKKYCALVCRFCTPKRMIATRTWSHHTEKRNISHAESCRMTF